VAYQNELVGTIKALSTKRYLSETFQLKTIFPQARLETGREEGLYKLSLVTSNKDIAIAALGCLSLRLDNILDANPILLSSGLDVEERFSVTEAIYSFVTQRITEKILVSERSNFTMLKSVFSATIVFSKRFYTQRLRSVEVAFEYRK